jgi:hypothetical protein
MTREKAIEKYKSAVHSPGGIVWCGSADEAKTAMARIEREAAAFVDAASAFGMLKLDEPESLDVRINRTLNMELLSGRDNCAGNIKKALEVAGLQIVEK